MDAHVVLFRSRFAGGFWMVDARLEAGRLEVTSGNGAREWFLRVAGEDTGRLCDALGEAAASGEAGGAGPALLARLVSAFGGRGSAFTEIRTLLDRAGIPYEVDTWTGD
jgi:hypothetical protein